MSFITSKSGIGSDTVIKIDGTDRTDWFRSFIPKTQIKTADVTALADTHKKAVETERSTRIYAVVHIKPETRQYFTEWKSTLNDQRTIEYSPDGTTPGQMKTTYEVLILRHNTQGDMLVLSFHANNFAISEHNTS